jgi:hypothetical protein
MNQQDELEHMALAIAEQNKVIAQLLLQQESNSAALTIIVRELVLLKERLEEVQSRSPGEW